MQDEIDFALKTVQYYKNTWEENERKCLQSDVDWYSRTREFDNNYADFFSVQDEEETNRLLDDFLRDEQDRRTANGDEEMTEAETAQLSKVFRQQQLTKLFHAPDDWLAYQAKKEAMEATAMPAAAEDYDPATNADAKVRTGSAMSSIKDMEAGMGSAAVEGSVEMGDDAAKIGPPYDPLVPQLWRDKLAEFAKLNVVKYHRIF